VNAFHVLGSLFAVWAVTLFILTRRNKEFPGGGGRERVLGAISIVLALAAISSAIITSALEDEEEGESHAEPASGGEELKLAADPGGKFAFDKKSLAAKPGAVTLAMTNPSQIQHDVSIEGPGVEKKGKVVGKGDTSTVSAGVKPGRYTYYCSVAGHRDGGMEGTLTVE
jgi:plastocyanin